ncbi:UNVERIFIED_CONTAM: hypothetical protein Scaly_2238800 [Sesamum calycinum]|uniref:Retrovirus-related Pol polyprotein from transposon TNT 1-94-like beta-barrel domain-containing protein n=1 Tax=Sesamum calycinum TaxID=2727403 RepID=A0AAW2MC91_9LAMI
MVEPISVAMIAPKVDLIVIPVTRPEPTDIDPRTIEIVQWIERDRAISGMIVSMGNSSTAEVLSVGSVDLKFPSEHILSLKRVQHVPTVRRNIISGSYSLTHEESDESRRSKRARIVKDFGSDFITYNIEDDPMDVKTAVLYAELDEKIYTDQLEGFVAHGSERKYMGEADVILGIKLIRSTDGIAISQSHYVEKIIEKFGYQNSRIAKTPYDSSVALFENESGVAVTQLRVVRYLKGTVSLVIHYGRFPIVLQECSDTNWIAKNSKSNGCLGYVFTLYGVQSPSWKCAKQTLKTRSTFEAELCALNTTGTEYSKSLTLNVVKSVRRDASSASLETPN